MMERQIRERTIEVVKEEGFICGKCNAKGNCADTKDIAIKDEVAFYWDKKEEKITCVKCGHQLTEKKELYDYIKVKEIQQYGFWLRFLSEHFVPCVDCQERIHKLIISKEMHIGSEEKPPVELWRRWEGITIRKSPNSVFVKEKCILCGNWFDADLKFIYDCVELHGYVCYDCGDKL